MKQNRIAVTLAAGASAAVLALAGCNPNATSGNGDGGGGGAEKKAADTSGTVGDGTYEVGTDIDAGTYKTDGPPEDAVAPMCYWERAKDSSGDLNSIIANKIVEGPGVVTVNAGEVATLSGGCEWVKQ